MGVNSACEDAPHTDPALIIAPATRIRLDAATVCQLRCPSCSTTTGETKRAIGGGYLKAADFKRLIDDNPSIKEIELAQLGEIFLNPDLLEIIRYAREKNVLLTCDNGANLNNVRGDVLEGLVRYRFNSIFCAIDGASQASYEKYRVGGSFDQVIENIRTINRLKHQYKSAYPILTWQFIVFGHNEHEIPLAARMAKELNMGFYTKPSWYPDFSPTAAHRRRAKTASHQTPAPAQRNEPRWASRLVCGQLWHGPQLTFDGTVLGCCCNCTGWGDFGNAFDDGLMPSLNGEKLRYARAMLLGRRPAREDIPCTRCPSFRGMRETGDWMTMRVVHLTRWLGWVKRNVFLGSQIYGKLYGFVLNRLF